MIDMNGYIPDNFDQWERHDAEQQRLLNRLPQCYECSEPIQDEDCYLINDELICPDCLNSNYRKRTEDFTA